MKKKIVSMILCAALAGSMLTGCGEKKEEDNKELVLYTWEGLFPQEVLTDFEDETGIRIISSNFDSNETMFEKVQQSDGKDYDLVIGDDYIIEQIVNNGLAKELDKEKLKNYDNINPLYQSQFYDPENKYTIPHGAGIPLIVYDPEQVDFEIQGYEDLWNPALEDKIATIASYRAVEGMVLLTMGKSMNEQDPAVIKEIQGYEDLWNPALEDKIATIASYRAVEGMVLLTMGKSMNEQDPAVIKESGEKLKELAPNIRMIQDTNTQNALLNGEASVGILYTSQVIAALAENPDLKVVYPKEGLGFGIMNFFIPKNAPDTEEAYAFLDYILEPEVAAKCFDFVGYYCTNKAADELVNPDLVVPDSVTKGEIIQNVSAEAEEVYNQNWTEFKAACD